MARNGGSPDPQESGPAPYFSDDERPTASRRWLYTVAGIGALALLVAIVVAVTVMSGRDHPPLVIGLSGEGSIDTRAFEVPAQWEIETDFGCHDLAYPGNFSVWVIDADGIVNALDTARAPNAYGAGGAARIIEPVGGRLSLQVYSDCSWSLRVLQ